MRPSTLRNIDGITLPDGWKPSEDLLSLEKAIKAITAQVFVDDMRSKFSSNDDPTTIVEDLACELLIRTDGEPALLSIRYLIEQGANIVITDMADKNQDFWYGEIFFAERYNITFKQIGQEGVIEQDH